MPPITRRNIVDGAIVLAVVWDVCKYRKVRKLIRKGMKENEILYTAAVEYRAQANYLVDMIKKYDVPIEDFDLIAMHNLKP